MAAHNHHSGADLGDRFRLSIILTVLILAVEVAGGIMSHSLALLSDAGHVFTDVIALSMSWYGVRQARRPASSRMTFGYHRIGVLIAIGNAVSIFAVAFIVFYEAYRRWQAPPEVNAPLMLVVALVGLAVNLSVAFWLSREHAENLNVRSAFWHAWGDALASVGVIAGGIIIYFTKLYIVDPAISVFIGLIIAVAAWRIFREGTRVLLEAVPHQVDVESMVVALNTVSGVKGVHDVHVWSISPEFHAMSGHVLIEDMPTSQAAEIRRRAEEVLREKFDIEHTSLQMECQECAANGLFCKINVDARDAGDQTCAPAPEKDEK